MILRSCLVAGVIAVALIADPVCARDLLVVGPGGLLQDAVRAAVFLPFAKTTGITIAEGSWGGGLDVLRAPHDPAWDVVLVSGRDLAPACDAGILEKLDWPAIGGKDRLLPQGVSDCGAGAFMTSIALAWDRDKFPGTPTWADFWDVARIPGKRGLRRGARGNLEIALLADGVGPSDIYRTLGNKDGVERAFRKLDQIKPYIAWWPAGGSGEPTIDAAQMLGSGEVLLTSAPTDRIVEANRTLHRNFGLQWAGALGTISYWSILKSNDDQSDSTTFLGFAIDPHIQTALLSDHAIGGLAKATNEGLPADVVAQSPTAPANLANTLLIDEQFWRDNGDKLNKRFDEWMGK